MSKCPNCGKINKNEAQFCINCGNQLNSEITNLRQTEDLKQDNSNNYSEHKNNKIKTICLGAIIIIILLALIGWFSGEDNYSSINIEEIPIPSGFTVREVNETWLEIINEGNPYYDIAVMSDDQISPVKFNKILKNKTNYTVKDTNDIKINNKKVKEETFVGENLPAYKYSLELGNKNYTVSCKTDADNWNVEDSNNPVNIILNSMINLSKNGGGTSNNNVNNNSENNKDNLELALEEYDKNYDPSLGVQVKVIYSGKWGGSITDSSTYSISGTGTKTFDINGLDYISAGATKKDATNKELTIQILNNGIVMEEAKTTAEYGHVQVYADYL